MHLDKGILYTLKSLVFNPGYTIRSFLAGKRVMHYNIFALFIIVIAIKTLIDYHVSDSDMFNSLKNKDTDVRINEAVDHYYKFFYLLSIPLLSIFSYLFSKRLARIGLAVGDLLVVVGVMIVVVSVRRQRQVHAVLVGNVAVVLVTVQHAGGRRTREHERKPDAKHRDQRSQGCRGPSHGLNAYGATTTLARRRP